MKKFIGFTCCIALIGIVGCGAKKAAIFFGLLALFLLFGHRNPNDVSNTGPQGEPGTNGVACWDVNDNGIADINTEDFNGDGAVDVYDCRGLDGEDGVDGQDGSSCSAVGNKDGSVTIVCGDGTSQSLTDDSDCVLKNNNNGTYNLSCGSESVTVVDANSNLGGISGVGGVPGEDGTDGVDGVDGVNGEDGVDGVDGTNGENGVDGQDGVDGTNGVDGENGTNGTNGIDGQDGSSCSVVDNENGTATLVCENGSEVTITLDQSGQASSFFDIYMDVFWKHGSGSNGIEINAVEIDQPKMTNQSSIAFLVAVPNIFKANLDAQITLRLFVYKSDSEGCPEDCFKFDILGKRLQSGSDIEDWGSTRSITPICSENGLLVIDLPLVNSCPFGLGYPMVVPGDLLAFELQTNCVNGADYVLLASELFSYSTTELLNATISCED